MTRIAILAVGLIVVVGCGVGSAAQSAPPTPTDLRITVWPEGRGTGDSKTYRLRCSPAAGTLPKVAIACSKLGGLTRPFAPVPRDAICTEQYGGPQEGLVTGKHRERSVWAVFSATNGCQISRAKRVAFLLPGFGTSGNA